MKRLIFLLATINLFFISDLGAIEKGKWIFVVDDNYCYIGSIPTNTEIAEGKKRDITYILVYRINNTRLLVQVYPHQVWHKNHLSHASFHC